ncbi:hypothetical protein CASFOL_023624 [Castilleja foliolosa]|uniref:X8 domain-containing protein n=1 Tax=Castilleja foliolosa TaxID=1961234 RepID=A0ABD3CPJ3_9LAMI
MAKLALVSFSLLLISLSSVCYLGLAGELQTYCVAKPSSGDDALNANIKYACDHVNCTAIYTGCNKPGSTLINNASVIMNFYYQKNGNNYWNCDFTKSGLITITDPSYENCSYNYKS